MKLKDCFSKFNWNYQKQGSFKVLLAPDYTKIFKISFLLFFWVTDVSWGKMFSTPRFVSFLSVIISPWKKPHVLLYCILWYFLQCNNYIHWKMRCSNSLNSKSHRRFICICINLFKYLNGMSLHQDRKYLQYQIVRLHIYGNFRLGIMTKGAGNMPASILMPTFIYSCLPCWSLCDSFIIYQEYITDEQTLCGSLLESNWHHSKLEFSTKFL